MSLFKTINPATEKLLKEYQAVSGAQLSEIVEHCVSAGHLWRGTDLEMRLKSVESFAKALRDARAVLAEAITTEMGKTLKESYAEVDKCVSSALALREKFPGWLAQNEYTLQPGFNISREPLGLILGIMPWNFPLWQVVRFALPTILCGNTVLLKHAPNTFGCAELLEDAFNKAFPPGVYGNLLVDVATVGQLIADPRVRGVSLTGSRGAGVQVGTQAGANLKKCVLELGGSDAYIVLDDADLDLAANVCVTSRLINGGQSCISAKRFVVTRKNSAAFTDKMHALLAKRQWGDPRAEGTAFGPMARRDLRDQLHQQVERSVKAGAKLVLGGEVPSAVGFYYPASLLVGVKPGQPAFDEELFGPVAAIIEATDEPQAIELANQSRYGLGAAVFSRDVERASRLAKHAVDAGMVFINDFVRSDALVPFGGVKDSGLGRELGREGSFEFTNVKTVFRHGQSK